MDHKIIPTLLSIGFLVFCLYLVFQKPIGQINAMCAPVNYVGQVFSATARMADGPASADAVTKRFDGYFHGCRLWFWNVIYEKKYRELKEDSGGSK